MSAKERIPELFGSMVFNERTMEQYVPQEAMEVWRDMTARGLGGLMPYIELSKAYEHRLRDYKSALEIVERAQSRARALGDSDALTDLEHRRRRILQKLSKAGG